MITINIITNTTTVQNVNGHYSSVPRATLTIPSKDINIRWVWTSESDMVKIYEIDHVILGLGKKIAVVTVTDYGTPHLNNLVLSILDDDYYNEHLLDGWRRVDNNNWRHNCGATFWTEESIDV